MGSLETRVRADIASLGELTGIQPSRAEIAYALARRLDDLEGEPARGPDPTAAIAKELRATLEELAKGAEVDDRTGQIFELFAAPVPTEVGNSAQPAPGDARPAGRPGGDAAGYPADAVAASRPGRRCAVAG